MPLNEQQQRKKPKYFWCTGCHEKRDISEEAEELQGKRLCKICYAAGWRLKIGVVVTVVAGGR